MAVQCVRVTRRVRAASQHIDQRFVATCFKNVCVCVCVRVSRGGGSREGVGRLYLTNTGIMSLRRPVKCAIFIVCT